MLQQECHAVLGSPNALPIGPGRLELVKDQDLLRYMLRPIETDYALGSEIRHAGHSGHSLVSNDNWQTGPQILRFFSLAVVKRKLHYPFIARLDAGTRRLLPGVAQSARFDEQGWAVPTQNPGRWRRAR